MKFLMKIAIVFVFLVNTAIAQNFFKVTDPNLQRIYGPLLEDTHTKLAQYWTGKPPKPSYSIIPVNIKFGGAGQFGGGSTSFVTFGNRVQITNVNVRGSSESIIYDVIPHELTHVVLHMYLNRSLPLLWNEGAAQLVETEASHQRYRMWVSEQVIDLKRWKHFSEAVDNSKWKDDVFANYSEGFSVVEYLVGRGGPRKFTDFLAGNGSENAKLKKFYDFKSLDALEVSWYKWFKKNSKKGYDCNSFNCPYHSVAKPMQIVKVFKPILYVFSDDSCQPCRNFKRDVRQGKFNAYNVKYVGFREWVRVTGDRNPNTIPRFYIKGSNRKPEVGYGSSPGLLQILASIVGRLGSLIFNPEAEKALADTSPYVRDGGPSAATGEPYIEDPAPVPKEKDNPEIEEIKSDVSNILSDIKTLKDGSVFAKLPALLRLKGDIADLKKDGKQASENFSTKISETKAEFETIVDVAKQDVHGLKSALAVLKDGEASKIAKAVAIAPALKKIRDDIKSAKDLLGDSESPHNMLLGILGAVIGAIKGFFGGKKQ